MNLPCSLERTVLIRARRATVFSFFTTNARFADWWGKGSTIDPRPGGAVAIRYPNGIVAGGEVVAIEPGARIVFTYGFESGRPFATGASRVAITLHDDALGTRVELRHEFADPEQSRGFEQGWRYQLSVFATVAAAVEHAGCERAIDAWFATWNATAPDARAAGLAGCCTEDVTFRDPNSALVGRDDLAAHIGAAQQFMPGVLLRRLGPVRQCQGTALADWQLLKDGVVVASGSNVFELAPGGHIQAAVGLPQPH
jgi:uncharacterized protein YndB with AHSA1/START domain